MTSKQALYKGIITFLQSSQNLAKKNITAYAEVVNELKSHFPIMSWVGIYEKDPDSDYLYLSTYVGDLACERIDINKGVCGKCFREKATQLVDDVTKIPYHIACSSKTRSEIVVPLFDGKGCVAVLDIDSEEHSAFDEIDRQYLEEIGEILN